MRYRILLSNLALCALLLLGAGYLLLEVVRIDPTAKPFTVTVYLAQSGGLLDTSEVTYRGSRVGQIEQIGLRPGGVAVRARLDEGTRIPSDTEVAVANLSAAGEQYLDFRPRTDAGPFLTGGATVEQRDTSTPTPFAQLMVHLGDLSGQVEPGRLDVIVTELAKAFSGSGPQLRRILTGGEFLLTGLEEVLPETVRILDNGRITLDTVAGLRDELDRFGTAGRTLGAQLRASDPEIRQLLDASPDAFKLVDGLIAENKPTMAALLGDLGTVSEIVSVRKEAIGEFLPGLTGLGDSLAGVVRNGALQIAADIYPRAACDYDTPRRPPTEAGSPAPRLYRYCTDTAPDLQQRGAVNAPRPPGDDTAGPPPGVTGDERASAPSGWASDYLATLGN
ncbi:MCE family protein [Amycolatopsis nigrescens]|uniref:MCE family protein n=1 Tax=Amycolatopsis nigrescens TaxID=381445 RepID=UPI0003653556|nr:MCE family protein [Amycolatopsis nigrescens]